jgi:hypothetical protein
MHGLSLFAFMLCIRWYARFLLYFHHCLLTIVIKRGKLLIKSWIISIIMIAPVLFASLYFPEELILENGDSFYLNVNIFVLPSYSMYFPFDHILHMAHGWWKDVSGWPFSLIPKEHTPYFIFLHLFSAFKFSLSYVVLKICTKFIL